MASTNPTYLVRASPDLYPGESTAFDGYLWKIQVAPSHYILTDLDHLAATEMQSGRLVTIVSFDGLDRRTPYSMEEL